MLLCVQTNESTHDSWWIWCQFGWVKGFAHSCKPRFHMCPSGCFQNRSELQSVDTVKWFATEAHVGKHQPPRCGAVWALFEAGHLCSLVCLLLTTIQGPHQDTGGLKGFPTTQKGVECWAPLNAFILLRVLTKKCCCFLLWHILKKWFWKFFT